MKARVIIEKDISDTERLFVQVKKYWWSRWQYLKDANGISISFPAFSKDGLNMINMISLYEECFLKFDKASREARISMLHLLLTEDSVYLGTKQGPGKYQVAYDAKDEETVVELQNLEL